MWKEVMTIMATMEAWLRTMVITAANAAGDRGIPASPLCCSAGRATFGSSAAICSPRIFGSGLSAARTSAAAAERKRTLTASAPGKLAVPRGDSGPPRGPDEKRPGDCADGSPEHNVRYGPSPHGGRMDLGSREPAQVRRRVGNPDEHHPGGKKNEGPARYGEKAQGCAQPSQAEAQGQGSPAAQGCP